MPHKLVISMNLTTVSLAIVLSLAPAQIAQCDGNMSDKISIRVEKICAAKHKLRLNLVVTNQTNEPQELISPEIGIGRGFYSFVIKDPNGANVRIVRAFRDITGPPTNDVIIKPNSGITFKFDLMDGTWSWPLVLPDKTPSRIFAEIDIPTMNLRGKNYWLTGHVSSPAVDMGVSFWAITGNPVFVLGP